MGDLGIEGNINIVLDIKERVYLIVNWIQVAQDWVQCRALVNTY
jgi:hypothetical protein